MPACLTRTLGFPAIDSLKMEPNQITQTIITPSSSLKRTLSADMASEKWMSQTGLKKSASLKNLHEEDDIEEIWSSIQKKEDETEKPKSQTDIWSSILAQNERDANKTVPPPYIHPLMKRSSSLSEKSLEICTESLGSETGSDCFSPDPDSDSGNEEYKEAIVVEVSKETESPPLQQEVKVVVSSFSVKTKSSVAGIGSPARSFPPPLPSLAYGGDGSNVQMRSHRENGRLVLEAVSVPTNNCFKAKRHDGRLLLTFSDSHVSDSDLADVDTEEDSEQEEASDEFENDDVAEEGSDVEEEEEEADDVEGTHKFLGLTKRVNATTWPRKLNRVVNTLEDNRVNPYVYSWRSKSGPSPIEGDGVAMEGKKAGKNKEEVIPLYLKGCNLQQQPRRSVLLWEAHCIAT